LRWDNPPVRYGKRRGGVLGYLLPAGRAWWRKYCIAIGACDEEESEAALRQEEAAEAELISRRMPDDGA
jgi:hypothetical protein